MKIRIGLEIGIENRILAWALDYPGCFTYGEDEAEVLLRLPHALLKYEVWIKDHTDQSWVNLQDMDISVVQVFHTWYIDKHFNPSNEGYEVNAWFTDDWRPLTTDEIERALLIFRWQREELLAGVSTLSEEVLQQQYPDQRWNILGILKHIANAESWYFDRMDYPSLARDEMPPDPIERLNALQKLVESDFPHFADEFKVIGKQGEFWSCRKIVRRTLWHQRDHIEHIKQLAMGD